MSPTLFAINLGGEGEIPGVINQQGPWAVLDPRWLCSRDGRTFHDLVRAGIPFLICPNTALPFPDGTVDVVHTEGVPIDIHSTYGPGVQSSEIERILKPGGVWIDEGSVKWTKP